MKFRFSTLAAAALACSLAYSAAALPALAAPDNEDPAELSESEDGNYATIYDMRGDDGTLMSFRPSGVAFLSENRLFVCDSADQQMHIFDTEGRRFRRMAIPREVPVPTYSGMARLEGNTFLVTGDHYHAKNAVRFVNAHSVIHKYGVRGELFDEDSAQENFDPNIALRKTGLLGENLERRMKIDGIAIDQDNDEIFFGLSKPWNDDDDYAVIIYTGSLSDVMNRNRKMTLTEHSYDIHCNRIDPLTEQQYQITDLCHVPGKGLLILMASKQKNDIVFGSTQIWFKPDGSETAQLIGEDIAPGNFGSGIAAFEKDGLYKLAIVFDNNPAVSSHPSRLMILDDVEL